MIFGAGEDRMNLGSTMATIKTPTDTASAVATRELLDDVTKVVPPFYAKTEDMLVASK
jgi:hypothetical protein